MRKNIFSFFLYTFALLVSSSAIGESKYREGEHYFAIKTAPTKSKSETIKVTEIFWYACRACYKLEGAIKTWEASLPSTVKFDRSPAVLRKSMAIHAKLFFLPSLLKIEQELHNEIFKEIHENKNKLSTDKEITQFFENYGIEKSLTEEMLNSHDLSMKVKRADARARRYKVEGTPTFIVNGQYRISTRLDGGLIEMLDVADFLIQKIASDA